MNHPADPAPASVDRYQESDRQDAAELRRFGYLQQLRRSMGAFNSFAISFSMISITTGIFANFGAGVQQVGPALVWSWLLVVVGQLLVALVLAEMAVRIPVSGYGYQWASRLVNPHVGFFVGWLLVLQFVTGYPGICHTLGEQLHGFLSAHTQRLHGPQARLPIEAPWLTVLIMTATAFIHLFGIRLAALVNSAGVLAEILGASTITLALAGLYGWRNPEGLSVLLDHTQAATQSPAGLSAFALSLLMGAWTLTGFEAAADLAEETHQPRQTIPRAIISSELSSGIGGFLMLCAFMLAIPNLSEVQASSTPLLLIIRSRLGDTFAAALMLIVFVSIFNCGVASMAHTTRLLFALARDNMLPFSNTLKAIHPRTQTPTNAILVVWMISSLVVLGLRDLRLITSIATVAGYLGYGAMVATSLIALRGAGAVDDFSLGRWRPWLAGAALLWTLLVVCCLTVPASAPTSMPDGGEASAPSQAALDARVIDFANQHLPAVTTLAGLLIGLTIYGAWVRPRVHRGEAGPPVVAPQRI